MRLSIIIPVYNVREYLNNTIETVLQQKFHDFELLLIDDGSTDGSGVICDQAATKDKRVRVIHKANGGVSDARNVGIAAAQGEFIGFVDSDDLIEPNMYEQLFCAQQQYNADIVQCRHNRKEISVPVPAYSSDDVCVVNGEGFLEHMSRMSGSEYTNCVSLWSKIFRKQCFDGIEFPVGRTYEDEQATYRLCLNAKRIVLLNEEYYHYIRREGSIITGVTPKKMLDKQLALRDRFVDLNTRLPKFVKWAANSFYGYSAGILVKLHATGAKEYEVAKECLLKHRKELLPYLDKYGKAYICMLSWFDKWVVKNDFEPIQKWIRRIRGENE